MIPAAPSSQQVIALGGMFQACHLVQELARKGRIPSESFSVCIQALMERDPRATLALYRQPGALEIGYDAMDELLATGVEIAQSEALRYLIGVLHLRKRLYRSPATLDEIARGIEAARQQAEHFSPTHENVIANLAGIYQDNISKFRFRIQVNGFADYLQQPVIAQKIRCLLFSGIRSAVLWHQLGGRRYHLILYRRKILASMRQLRR